MKLKKFPLITALLSAAISILLSNCANQYMEQLLKDKTSGENNKPTHVLQGIVFDPSAVKRSIEYGSEFSLSGLVIIEKWSDGDVELVYGEDFDDDALLVDTNFDANTPGAYSVSVTYEGKTGSFNVYVTPPGFIRFEFNFDAVTKDYGYGVPLSLDGFTITAIWEDGPKAPLVYGEDFTDADLDEVTGYDAHAPGNQTVTVTYNGNSAAFDVTVAPPVFLGFEFNFDAVTKNYGYGVPLSLDGFTITEIWEDGPRDPLVYGEDFGDDDLVVTGYDAHAPGAKTITVTYGGKTDSFDVTVALPGFVRFEFDFDAVTKDYPYSVPLSLDGFTITEIWEDGPRGPFVYGEDFSDDDLIVTGYNALAPGGQTVSVTYKESTDTFDVTVGEIPWVLDSIEISAEASSLAVYYDTSVDDLKDELSGKVTAVYKYGDLPDKRDLLEDVSALDISGYDPIDTSAPQTVTVTYEGKTATLEVTIKKGDGSAEHPWIVDGDTLLNIGTGGYSLSGYYKQGVDIDLTGKTWTPIGTSGAPFTGSYDGGGHEITNLTITSSNGNSGLFGYLRETDTNTGEIRNLGLVNVTISGSGGGLNNIGAFVANNTGGIIENCYITGSVSGQGQVGGLVGTNNTGGIIRNCYSAANVTGTSNQVGGIVGYNNGGTVENCYASGTINGSTNVGGVVGQNGGTVVNCVALNPNIVATQNNPNCGRVMGSGGAASSANYGRVDMTKNGAAWGTVNIANDGTSITDEYTLADWWKDTALFTDAWWWGDTPRLPPQDVP